MIRRFAIVLVALILVLSAAGYGIIRGFTDPDYSDFNACIDDWNRAQMRGAKFGLGSPLILCEQYRPGTPNFSGKPYRHEPLPTSPSN